MKALVTGCAGFIGSTLCDRLLADGADVTGIDCFTDYYARDVKERNLGSARQHAQFRFVDSRIQDVDLPALLHDRTHVFHLAAQAGVRKSWGRDFSIYTVNNIEATQYLLEAATKMPALERLIYSSSSSVYGDRVAMPMREDALPEPVSPYGVSKLAAEQLCYLYFANFNVPTVSLRYFTVYGPRQRPDMAFHKFLRAAALGEPIGVYGDGDQTRDFTFVSDAVNANVLAATRGVPGRVYNIGGGSRVSVNDVLAMIQRVTGRTLRVNVDSVQKGDMRHTYADTSRALADLGYAPTVGLEQGLAAEYQWLTGILLIKTRHGLRHLLSLCLVTGALAAAGACASGPRSTVPAGTTEPDKFLFDKGTDALNKKKWLTAREFFKQVTETYTASPYRPDAKLGIGDTYLGEGSSEALVLAINEFSEFLSFYPTNRRADYAQYKLGMAHFKQMRLPQRDQTETRAALKEFDTFIARYPNSSLISEARDRWRETRDRLSEADYQVGYFYYRQKWYPGAIDRFRQVLKDDPGFTNRDSVYFFLADALVKVKREAEALPLLEKLVQEFEKSEHLVLAQKMITDLKAQVAKQPGT